MTPNRAGGGFGFSPYPKITSQGGDTRFWGLWWNKGWMCCPSQWEEQKINFMNLNKRLISVRREGRDREELQTISTLQALTESLMRDKIQLRRRMGNLGNACIYSSKLLMAPPYSPPQLWWLSKQEINVQMKYSSWKYLEPTGRWLGAQMSWERISVHMPHQRCTHWSVCEREPKRFWQWFNSIKVCGRVQLHIKKQTQDE